jgi:hypothetical protein
LAANLGSDGFLVTLFVVREQALEKHNITVSCDADIKHTVAVMKEDLPLVYRGRV